ncbi:TetR/AcrR family transcriptional regulator [Falsigemmobacter faecalis]|uniref:TetR/AcrR family transcriptional regulator n=1 Tax=Falsigemmobacter faecalis TaxID=2488730 RepID=A0A3P3DEV5_9RHOB|nr:TetR/AcrR family transcriptional regulator [Falsigemmobacter faecalis]RRH72807.1 TetR/AcrR family transcriptional regulator [Falsigemmobacter faecalis]
MHTEPPKPRRRMAPQDRRRQIVAGAVSYFAETGLSGNTRDLSQRLGVTQSLIFKHFPTKAALHEAVYEQVFLSRIEPHWPALLRDRRLPLIARMGQFYTEYTRAIFTYEWMRIFMFSGLEGAELNRRYLGHLQQVILSPMLEELNAAIAPAEATPEDIWRLHGSIIYIGIRRFVYQTPVPEDEVPAVLDSVAHFLGRWPGLV